MSGSEQAKNKDNVAAIMRAKQIAGKSSLFSQSVSALEDAFVALRMKSCRICVRC